MLKKQFISVAGVTAIAQVAALVKLWFVAHYFGVGAELDGYNLAFMAPTIVSGAIFAVVQTGFFPIYSGVRLDRGEEATASLERAIFWGLLGFGFCASVLVACFSQELASLVAWKGAPSQRTATAYVLGFASWAIVLNVLGDFLGFVLAVRGRFLIAAAAPIANAAVGAALLVAWPEGRLTNLALGTVLGIALQTLIAFIGARSAGFDPLRRFELSAVRRDVLEVVRLGSLIFPGAVFVNLTSSVPAAFVVPYGEGAVSAFGYAYRFHQTTVQLVVMAASPVLLARFSELVALREWTALHAMRRKSLIASLAVGAAGLLLVAVLGRIVLTFVFSYGSDSRFDAAAAEQVARNWIGLTLGLPFALHAVVLSKQLQALKRPAAFSVSTFFGFAAFVASTLVLDGLLKEDAVPLAVALASLTTVYLMNFAVKKTPAHAASLAK